MESIVQFFTRTSKQMIEDERIKTACAINAAIRKSSKEEKSEVTDALESLKTKLGMAGTIYELYTD